MAGRAAINAILAAGLLTFVLLMFIAAQMKQGLKPDERQRVKPREHLSSFERDRAMRDLEALLKKGPRPSGSPAAQETVEYIAAMLRQAGLRVRQQRFGPEQEPSAQRNITGVIEGDRPGVIVLAVHYDTYAGAEPPTLGANAGGAGTAWLLEVARMLGPTRHGRTLWLSFLDAEAARDSGRGANALLAHAAEDGADLDALLYFEGVGDCYLLFFADEEAPEGLMDALWQTARRIGYGRHFAAARRPMAGAHGAAQERGIPALAVIDDLYGGTIAQHRLYWHTDEDTISRICPDSLRALADVLYHALPAVERWLDSREAPANDEAGTRGD